MQKVNVELLLTDRWAADRTRDLPVVDTFIKNHVCFCGGKTLFSFRGKTYKFNIFKMRMKGHLPLTEMSTSEDESKGQNLMTWGCR